MAEQQSLEQQIEAARSKLQGAFSQPEVPKIYANAFVSGYNNADFIVMLECNGIPVGVLNLSYILAKSLAQNILSSATEIENETGQSILTIDAMDQHRRNAESNRSQR